MKTAPSALLKSRGRCFCWKAAAGAEQRKVVSGKWKKWKKKKIRESSDLWDHIDSLFLLGYS